MKRLNNKNPFAITSEFSGNKKNNKVLINNKKTRSFDVDLFHTKTAKISHETLGLLVDKGLILFWLTFILLGIFTLFSRTAYLQVVQADHFSKIAEGNRIRIIDLKAPRGVIYDRHHNLLVENTASFSLAAIPVDLPKITEEIRELSEELSKISDLSSDEIFEILDKQSAYSYQPVILQENLTHDQAILAEIISGRFPGIVLRSASTRHYLKSGDQVSLSHILGYSGRIEEPKLQEYLSRGYLIDDYVGKAGVELMYETDLKGVNGRQQVEVDAIGESKEVLASAEPVPGQNLVLTIDTKLQEQVETSLARILSAHNKKRGAVVVMDPNSGEILSLVSLPAFDNNLFSKGINQENFSTLISDPNRPLFSRAISGEYPSGSTFKLIVGAAALEEGLINENTGFSSVGGIAVSSWFFPDWRAGGHGWTTLTKAIADSVNTFFYTIGGGYDNFTGLGVDRVMNYAEKFGLNKQLGIDLPNEADGFLPSKAWKEEIKKERWYIGDTYNLSIGQGDILVTPLQVASWTAVFANGGTLYKPYVVKDILDSSNNVVREIHPEILNQNFISPKNITIVNKGLRQAVTSGSAVRLLDLPVQVAAKTGTAQWASQGDPHAWVTAFAPYDNPQIVVTVLVEEGEGGTITAMPVVYDIINWWANNR